MSDKDSQEQNVQVCTKMRRDWIRNNLPRFIQEGKPKYLIKELQDELKELNQLLFTSKG
ncbi:MAG: hypothetical protein GY804_03975 [Alphaproteobacteria bacterium]|nr:hypothetical protein [Alphaproteobacteria bacterium]